MRSHPGVVVLSASRTLGHEQDEASDDSSPYEKLRRFRIIQKALLGLNSNKKSDEQQQLSQLDLIEMECIGRTFLPLWKGINDEGIDCCVLGASKSQSYPQQQQRQSCLLLPIANPSHFQLLEWIRKNKHKQTQYISKQRLLTLNGIVLNRDQGLFDNLPYDWWCSSSLDAANNPIERKFQMGKRIFYNQMAGQDWYRDREIPLPTSFSSSSSSSSVGTSTSPMIQELWKQLQTQWKTMSRSRKANNSISEEHDVSNNPSMKNGTIMYDDFNDEFFTKRVMSETNNDYNNNNNIDTEATTNTLPRTLMKRILELRIRELVMDLANVESQMAQRKQQLKMQQMTFTAVDDDDDEITNLQQQQASVQAQIDEYRLQLSKLSLPSSGKASASLSSMDFLVVGKENDTPAGRKSTLDDNARQKKYLSPYHFLQHLVDELLQAEIIGGFLENASLIHSESPSGAMTLGGGIVLQKRNGPTNAATTTIQTILGERVKIRDDPTDDDAESIHVVECDADESVGLCTALGIPLFYLVDGSMMTAAAATELKHSGLVPMTKDIIDDIWKPVGDTQLLIVCEGQRVPANVSAAPVRLPLFSSSDDAGVPMATSSSLPLFPTDNPIQNLSAYDALSMEDKARVLVTLSNFNWREQGLPRPRNLRNDPTLLDELLLPLIDESVRSQYRIRQAQRNGDLAEMQRLQALRSQRVLAQQRAEDLYARGDIDSAQYYESEAEFLKSLRADPTQDEGSYSRFLDRDEWYERNRRRTIPDKSKFGNLLDGVE
jgi:hypothetical protein